MKPLIVVIVGLGIPGFLPALAAARRSPAIVFLAPVAGALMAAVGAQIELGIGGSLVTGYVLVAVVVNLAVIVWWLTMGRSRPRVRVTWLRPPSEWYVFTLVILLGVLAFPLTGLHAEDVGWDTNSIWITHAQLVSGGHHVLLTGLTDPSYLFANPDYPPLLPAAGALGYAFFGRGDILIPAFITELMAACGLGLVGTGIAALGHTGRQLTRFIGLGVAAALCLAGFAVSGVPGISGYADLPWAAVAVAAIIWGLVLPRSNQALVIAWICAAAASLMKNEGLTTALALIVLIAFRYRPLTLGNTLRAWMQRAAFVVIPAVPGVISAVEARLIGLADAFFRASSTQSLATRARATVDGMAQHLAIAPVAVAVLIIGSLYLRRDRMRMDLANPLWLWAGALFGVAGIFITYLTGGFSIQAWLNASVDRTMIFAQLALYAEVAIWLVIAVDAIAPEAIAQPAAVSVNPVFRHAEHVRPAGPHADRLTSGVKPSAPPSEMLN
jgi:hypothetical protein